MLKLSPLTRKRITRFCQLRRASWSLWTLLLLYGLSLFSELIANDRPLIVRFNGQYFFPVFRHYPDDLFTGSGLMTRPDYRTIHDSSQFHTDAGNFMVFPVVPYSPYESIDTRTINVPRTVTIHITPEPHVGTINVHPDLTVARSHAAGIFFAVDDDDVRGLSFRDHWIVPADLLDAVEQRFTNKATAGIDVVCQHRAEPRSVIVSLSNFRPRRSAPRTVRLTLRESETSGGVREQLTVAADGDIDTRPLAIWPKISADVRAEIMASAMRRFTEFVEPENVVVAGDRYSVRFEKMDVHYPFPPVRGHWLGLDSSGRDVLARLIYGLRTSLNFAFVLVAFSMTLGTLLGALQGYYGGMLDIVGQRLIEVWSALPFLYVIILMGNVFGQSFGLLLVCYAIFNWIGVSYYMRGEFLRLRSACFVDAARCMGLSGWQIMVRHILPNALVPLITLTPFLLVGAIGVLTALDYLGFGLPVPTPSWGELLAQAQGNSRAWWLVVFPASSLFVVMLLGVFIGEGLRVAFDPRRQVRWE